MDRITGGKENLHTLNPTEQNVVREVRTETGTDILCFATAEGVVQGVGFRPYVAHCATAHEIRGWVRNTGGRVEILARGSRVDLDSFFADVRKGPLQSDIKRFTLREIPFGGSMPDHSDVALPPGSGFLILESETSASGLSMPPADLCVCEECLLEMTNPANRRYRHPFISCTSCGPRYSILESLPYDRHTTAMIDFPMCPACEAEYRNAGNRRHHAQTISCHDCGPQLCLTTTDGIWSAGINPAMEGDWPAPGSTGNLKEDSLQRSDAILAETVRILLNGGLVAVKGIGGYHLLCDPRNDDAVIRLRLLKKRDAKPFAVMFPAMEEISSLCEVDEPEAALLGNVAHPIVLLRRKEDPISPLSPQVCPGSRYIGAFLPYTPLHGLLLQETGPLVATSANLSGHPIVADDEVMTGWLGKGLDAVLSHTRRIVTPQDDSVAWVIDGEPQLIRRARGYAPLTLPMRCDGSVRSADSTQAGLFEHSGQPLHSVDSEHSGQTPHSIESDPSGTILALGGQQKAGWCLVKDGYAHMGEYLGDLDDEAAWLAWTRSIDHAVSMLGGVPDRVACDLHPRYRNRNLPLLSGMRPEAIRSVQHHHAHIASIMAEHELTGPVLGISFDGTGYGSDGTVWGGEFLLCRNSSFKRMAALKPIRMLGGDSSVEEGWKSLLCHLHAAGLPIPPELAVPTRDALVLSALRTGVNTLESSSMGRLFDAVSALLGFASASRYEGECAILLETAAADCCCSRNAESVDRTDSVSNKFIAVTQRTDVDIPMGHVSEGIAFASHTREDGLLLLDPTPVLTGLLSGLKDGMDRKCLALAFHQAVACGTMEMLTRLTDKSGIRDVALSGGVFQNRQLLDLLLPQLRGAGYRIRLQRQVPPNDGGLALGQAYAVFASMANEDECYY